MLGIVKKVFIFLLTNIVNFSNHPKYVPLSNQKWENQPTLINLHPKNTIKNFTNIQLWLS